MSKISVLTCGPGVELSSTFGHTAIRIQDPTVNLDIVLGYGGFDFEEPGFYWKFTTGKLDYRMTGHRFPRFLEGYKKENRWVSEQVLELSLAQKKAVYKALIANYSIEDWGYKYDFLFDNCATRIPDIFKNTLGDQMQYDYSHLDATATFRELIHETLVTNSWATLGIDLALGSVIDKKATPWEYQFLPIYVSEQLPNTVLKGKPLSNKKTILFKNKPQDNTGYFLLSPLFWCLFVLLGTVFISYNDYRKNKRTRWLDFGLFFLTGAAGLLICFLWFATDHSATKLNFNMLWAMPINIIVAFVLAKTKTPPRWVKKYLWLLIGCIATVTFLWLFKIQIFSPLIIFLLLALGIRYLFLQHYFKLETKNT